MTGPTMRRPIGVTDGAPAAADSMARKLRAGNYGWGHAKEDLFQLLELEIGAGDRLERDPGEAGRRRVAHQRDQIADHARAAPGRGQPQGPTRALLYFWGLGLSTQGFITPVNEHGPESGEFWMHWLNHGAIIGAALYDLVVLRFRPHWRDWRTAVVLGIVYVACVFVLNIISGWNYGYVGATKPDVRTIVDFLGPWPLRVIWIVLIAIFAMMLLMLPWEIARRIARPSDKDE